MIDRKSTNELRGPIDLMISWEHIPTRENMYHHMGWGQTQSTLHMPVVPLSCITLEGLWDNLEEVKCLILDWDVEVWWGCKDFDAWGYAP